MKAKKNQMFAIMKEYFTDGEYEIFEKDLNKKTWAFIAEDSGTVVGFSLLERFLFTYENKDYMILYSGDTIIRKEYWGQCNDIWRLMLDNAINIQKESDMSVYWFLISSGYKTYRFLPTLFNQFYPKYNEENLEFKSLVNHLAEEKFGDRFDSEKGVIKVDGASMLQEWVAPVDEKMMKNKHIAFYIERNPGHIYGDELACLTEISPSNLTRAAKKMIGLVDE